MDLFTELLETVLETVLDYRNVATSHVAVIPALHHLRKMADDETIDRCLAKLAAERAELAKAQGLTERTVDDMVKAHFEGG